MRAPHFLGLCSLSVLMLSGCAQRMDEIEERVDGIQKRTAILEAKSGNPVGSDRDLLEGQKLADVRSQVAAMRNDITVLSGKVEALEYENKNTQARLDQTSKDLENQTRELEKKASASSAQVAQAAPASSGASDLETDYNTALRAHQDGNFDKAEKLFQAYLSKYPKSKYNDRALFWMGEGYMARKSYKKAITKFQDLIEKYPKSDKRCEALGRQIVAFNSLGMKKEAGEFAQVKNSECGGK